MAVQPRVQLDQEVQVVAVMEIVAHHQVPPVHRLAPKVSVVIIMVEAVHFL